MNKLDYNKENHKIIRKRMDCFALYAYENMLEEVRLFINNKLSEKSRDLFRQLTKSIHNDIGHLECDEVTACYAIEEGYNFDD